MGTSTEHFLPHSDNHNSLASRQRTVLQSWKEIASELGRGVRTVQRWEQTLGLPVHRLGKGARCPVFAFKDELDFWFRKKAWAGDLENTLRAPGDGLADSFSKQRMSSCGCDSRTNRPLRTERALRAPNSKPRASVLQSLNDFFALESSREKPQNCRYCLSALQFFEGRFSLYGTDMEWKIQIPYCPSCNGEMGRESCPLPTTH